MAVTNNTTSKRKGKSNKQEENSLNENKAFQRNSELSVKSNPSNSLVSWGSLLVAFLALGLGLITPPLLRHQDNAMDKRMDVERSLIQNNPTGVVDVEVNPCSENILENFWSDAGVPGYHIICLKKSNKRENSYIQAVFYENGLKSSETTVKLPFFLDWESLKQSFVENLGLPLNTSERQPWALYSTAGVRLVSESEREPVMGQYPGMLVRDYGVFLLFESGQFIWPGIRIGFRRSVDLYSVMPPESPDLSERHRVVELETLSVRPLVLSVTGFLSTEECQHIQRLAEPSMEYSEVVLMDKDAGRPASDFRTSQTTFVRASDDFMIDIDYRTSSLVRLPRSHQESVQVLRYGLGEKYDNHHDYFDPRAYQSDQGTLQRIKNGQKNRMATVFWYLSDVVSGGETIFPRFNGGVEKNMKDCETGLKVKPEMGKVIIFYSMTPDGKLDPLSLHGACPVKEGVKWAANKWVWNEPLRF